MIAGLRALLVEPQALLEARRSSRQRSMQFDIRNVVSQYQALFREAVH
jgi:hypothetical protein